METLGITGGIGSGKSYVCHLLAQHYGIPVYDCDTEAKRLNEESPAIRKALIKLMGPEVFDASGHLNKPLLASYLFASEEHQATINAIIHPIVRQDFETWRLRQGDTPVVALESAILLESGFSQLADKIICVTAPLEVRIQRTMQRDASTRQQVESRIARQISEEERIKASHHVIHNDGRDLMAQLQQILVHHTRLTSTVTPKETNVHII